MPAREICAFLDLLQITKDIILWIVIPNLSSNNQKKIKVELDGLLLYERTQQPESTI